MAILAGVDVILMPDNIDVAINAVEQALKQGRISRKLIKEKCKKILNWKYDMGLFERNTEYSLPDEDVLKESDSLTNQIYEKAITLVKSNGTLTSSDTVEIVSGRFSSSTSYYGVAKTEFKRLKKFNDSAANAKTLVIYGNAYVLRYIDDTYNFDNILVAYENNDFTRNAVSLILQGKMTPEGLLPVTAHKRHIVIEDEPKKEEYTDLQLLVDAGINPNMAAGIDSIVIEGIKRKAYPGCQVLIAKDNKIVFDRNYGFQTYDSVVPVQENTIYDVASLTKVIGTTLAVMKLYELGKIDLDAPVKTYLPEYKHCKFSKLTIKELMSHYSTLPATYPFWTKTVKNGELDSELYDYNVNMDENYMPVTDELYIKKSYLQTMRKDLKSVKLKDQQYTYSDLNFLLLQYIIEQVSGQSLDSFLDKFFYKKMKLENTCFNPLEKGISIDNIAPTEEDTVFRHQLIRGTVHDPMAALNGGVCGNAGLFSTAHDVYLICKMLLNKGELDGTRFLNEATIDVFNKRYFKDKNIRRALGFDKPFISSPSTHCSKYASQASFGHSGFTGTYFWIDPSDNTIFIFLSNRVYPDSTPNRLASMNIRTDIHDLIYRSIKDK